MVMITKQKTLKWFSLSPRVSCMYVKLIKSLAQPWIDYHFLGQKHDLNICLREQKIQKKWSLVFAIVCVWRDDIRSSSFYWWYIVYVSMTSVVEFEEAKVTCSKALRYTFFGERENLCSSKFVQLLLLNSSFFWNWCNANPD